MWPFSRKTKNSEIRCSQADVAANFDDILTAEPTDWIKTVPINLFAKYLSPAGLPKQGASEEEIYSIAANLSSMRDGFAKLPGRIDADGVYCPVCHIANTQLDKLRTPCPSCGRALLRFDLN